MHPARLVLVVRNSPDSSRSRRSPVVYGSSNNPRQFWDIGHARELLGYAPEDAAPV